MFFFFKNFLFFLSIIELTPVFSALDSQNIQNNYLSNYLYVFIAFFLVNIYLNQSINYNLNFDLIFKYFSFFLKNFSFLLNYIINTQKKIFLFLYHFKYRNIIKWASIFLKRYLSIFLIFWKPLFKKSSYFGYFRSNRSKWIK